MTDSKATSSTETITFTTPSVSHKMKEEKPPNQDLENLHNLNNHTSNHGNEPLENPTKCDLEVTAEDCSHKDNHFSIDAAVPAYNCEIQRGNSLLPARRRTVPSRFSDYKNVDSISDEETDDTDYIPSHKTSNGRRGNLRKAAVENKSPSKSSHEGGTKHEVAQPSRKGRKRKYKLFSEEELNIQRPYRCPEENCGQTFVSINALNRHMAGKHNQSEPSHKNSTVTDNSSPAVHDETLNKQSIKSEVTCLLSEKQLMCDICKKQFSQLGNLKAHMKTHTGQRDFQCDICEKYFSSAESLKRHKMSHLGIKPFVCDICYQKFASNVALREHKTRHLDSKPYECATCKRQFRQVSVYKRHLLTHSDEKPFKCSLCESSFSQRIYLRSHMKKHTGEKPHKCDLCEKRFAHLSDKKRHQRTHSGEKPYVCDYCQARFTDPSSCRRHIKEHMSEQHTCSLCGETFKRQLSLRAHLQKRHNISTDESPTTTSSGNVQIQMSENKDLVLMYPPHSKVTPGALTQLVDETGQNILAELHSVTEESITQENSVAAAHHTVVQPSGSTISMVTNNAVMERNNYPEQETRSAEQLIREINTVAYQVIHDDETKQVLEIQYQSGNQGVVTAAGLPDSVMDQSDGSVLQGIKLVLDNSAGLDNLKELSNIALNQGIVELPSVEQNVPLPVNQATPPSTEHEYAMCRAGGGALDNMQHVTHDQSKTLQHLLNQNTRLEHLNINEARQNTTAMNRDLVTLTDSYNAMDAPMTDGATDHLAENNVKYKQDSQSMINAPTRSQPEENMPKVTSSTYEKSIPVNDSPVTHLFVSKPDFSSQDYYNWLSSFTDFCQQSELPLSHSVFKSISQVHKSLSDVMATPKGILAQKDNFRILMSIAHDLNSIIDRHLMHILHELESQE